MEGQEQGEHTSFLCTLRTGQQEVRQSELEPLAVGWPRAADTMRLAGAAGSLGGNAITWGSGELQLAAEIYLLFISVVPWKLQQLGSSCLSWPSWQWGSSCQVGDTWAPGGRCTVPAVPASPGMSCKEGERDVRSQAQHQPQSKQEIPRHCCRLET